MNPNQVQETVMAVEITPAAELTSDLVRPAEEAVESADQSENTIMMETENILNHQEVIKLDFN